METLRSHLSYPEDCNWRQLCSPFSSHGLAHPTRTPFSSQSHHHPSAGRFEIFPLPPSPPPPSSPTPYSPSRAIHYTRGGYANETPSETCLAKCCCFFIISFFLSNKYSSPCFFFRLCLFAFVCWFYSYVNTGICSGCCLLILFARWHVIFIRGLFVNSTRMLTWYLFGFNLFVGVGIMLFFVWRLLVNYMFKLTGYLLVCHFV